MLFSSEQLPIQNFPSPECWDRQRRSRPVVPRGLNMGNSTDLHYEIEEQTLFPDGKWDKSGIWRISAELER